MTLSLSDTPDLAGRVAVVTGGSAGIGRDFCAQLLLHGAAKVHVLARSDARFAEARAEWCERHALSDSDLASRVDFIRCDLTDVDAVLHAARALSERLDRLDILMLNAALPPSPDYQLSPQGVELQFAANHLGHFVLANLLLPLVEKTASEHGQVRILTVSSSLHLACRELSLPLLTSPTPIKSPAALDSLWRHARSKLANILFTRELARRLDNMGFSNVYANSFFPGNIPADARDSWKDLVGISSDSAADGISQQLDHTPEDAVVTAMYLATSPDVVSRGVRGRYFVPVSREGETSALANDKDLQKNLWYWSDRKVTEALGKGWQDAASSRHV